VAVAIGPATTPALNVRAFTVVVWSIANARM
jgi:hypothetical protein